MNILYVIKGLSVVEPLGVLQLSAITRALGHQSFLAVLDRDDLPRVIAQNQVDLVAFSILSTDALAFRQTAGQIKSRWPELPIVAGGPHPTYFPQIADTWPIDAVVMGEGDLVMAPLLEAIEEGKGLAGVPNLRGKYLNNPMLPLVTDLDQLPYCDRGLAHAQEPLRSVPMKTFMASRGCPFGCAYCFNNAYKDLYRGLGPIRRQRSVQNLVGEIELVKQRYPLQFVRFGDDVFVTGHNQWLEEFCEEYARRVGLPFYILIHPHLVTPAVIGPLKRAGLHSVAISIEAGNETLRRQLLQRPVSDESVLRAYAILHDHDVNIFSNCMLGLPGSALDDDFKSLELTFKAAPTYASFTVFTPFPGTELYRQCLDKGYLDADFDSQEYPESTFQSSCLNIFTPREKDIQRNILLLGSLANAMPSLRGAILGLIKRQKPNRLFLAVSFLVRNYLQRKIWPFHLNLLSLARITWRVFRIDRRNYSTRRGND